MCVCVCVGGGGGVSEMQRPIVIPSVTALNLNPCAKDSRTGLNSVDPHTDKHKAAETVDADVFLVSVAGTDSTPKPHNPTCLLGFSADVNFTYRQSINTTNKMNSLYTGKLHSKGENDNPAPVYSHRTAGLPLLRLNRVEINTIKKIKGNWLRNVVQHDITTWFQATTKSRSRHQ